LQLLKNILPNNINSIDERDKAITVLPHMEATFNFLPEQVDDTTIYELGVDISGLFYKMGLSKKSLEINEKILSYALKMGDYAKYSDTLNAIAIAAHYSGDTNKGFEFIDDAIRQIDNISGVDIKIINALKASIYENKGIMLKNIQQLSNALDCFNMALVYAEKSESLNLICNQLINLAIVNRHMGKIDDAEDILIQAKKYCADDKRLEAKVYGNLGFLYRYKDYNIALNYFKISLERSREIMDQKTECTNLNHIGTCYMQLNMPDESYEYFNEAKKLALSINLQQAVVHSYNSLAIWYLNFRGDIEKAKEYFQNALSLSETIKYIDGIQAAKDGLEAIKTKRWW
jgi:tetratricopeptide (TPR) repeat protein